MIVKVANSDNIASIGSLNSFRVLGIEKVQIIHNSGCNVGNFNYNTILIDNFLLFGPDYENLLPASNFTREDPPEPQRSHITLSL